MAVKLRLRRMGRKKRPLYGVVASDSRSPRDGRFIEDLGRYEPLDELESVTLKNERILYWLETGAQPTDTVRSILSKHGLMLALHMKRKGASDDEIWSAVDSHRSKWAEIEKSKVKVTAKERRIAVLATEESIAKEKAVQVAKKRAEVEAKAQAELEKVREKAAEEREKAAKEREKAAEEARIGQADANVEQEKADVVAEPEAAAEEKAAAEPEAAAEQEAAAEPEAAAEEKAAAEPEAAAEEGAAAEPEAAAEEGAAAEPDVAAEAEEQAEPKAEAEADAKKEDDVEVDGDDTRS